MARNYNPHEVHPITYMFVGFLLFLTLVSFAPLFNDSSRDLRSSAQIAHPTRTRTPTPYRTRTPTLYRTRTPTMFATRTRTPTLYRTRTPTLRADCNYSSMTSCQNDNTGCPDATHFCDTRGCPQNSSGGLRAKCYARLGTGGGGLATPTPYCVRSGCLGSANARCCTGTTSIYEPSCGTVPVRCGIYQSPTPLRTRTPTPSNCLQSTCEYQSIINGQTKSTCKITNGKTVVYGCVKVTGINGCPDWWKGKILDNCTARTDGKNACGLFGSNEGRCYEICSFDTCNINSTRCSNDGVRILQCKSYTCGGTTGRQWQSIGECTAAGEGCTCGSNCNGLSISEVCN